MLNIVSWNICHFRKDKIKSHIATLHSVISWGHVCFIYEDHTALGQTLADRLNLYEEDWNNSGFSPYYSPGRWKGASEAVHGEYISVVWDASVRIGLEYNRAATSTIQSKIPGERAPAVFNVSQDGKTKVVGAWHAFGPAKQSAQSKFATLQQLDCVDVIIGDFNFQSLDPALQSGGLVLDDAYFALIDDLDYKVPGKLTTTSTQVSTGHRSARIRDMYKMKEILPSNYRGATTFTSTSSGKRKSGLDRCLVRTELFDRASLMVALPNEPDETIKLTDHVPLLLTINWD